MQPGSPFCQDAMDGAGPAVADHAQAVSGCGKGVQQGKGAGIGSNSYLLRHICLRPGSGSLPHTRGNSDGVGRVFL
jgi:hypothetical protein